MRAFGRLRDGSVRLDDFGTGITVHYQRRVAGRPSRIRNAARRWTALAPYLTAGLVLLVGLGLAIRSLRQI